MHPRFRPGTSMSSSVSVLLAGVLCAVAAAAQSSFSVNVDFFNYAEDTSVSIYLAANAPAGTGLTNITSPGGRYNTILTRNDLGVFFIIYPHDGTDVCIAIPRANTLPTLPDGSAFASWPLVGAAAISGETFTHRRMVVPGTATKIGVYIRNDSSLAACMNAGGMAETQRLWGLQRSAPDASVFAVPAACAGAEVSVCVCVCVCWCVCVCVRMPCFLFVRMLVFTS